MYVLLGLLWVLCRGCTLSGPGVAGLVPREASDRLQAFQAQFDELWRKYITFSGGEELFGLPVKGNLSHLKSHLARNMCMVVGCHFVGCQFDVI